MTGPDWIVLVYGEPVYEGPLADCEEAAAEIRAMDGPVRVDIVPLADYLRRQAAHLAAAEMGWIAP